MHDDSFSSLEQTEPIFPYKYVPPSFSSHFWGLCDDVQLKLKVKNFYTTLFRKTNVFK